MYRPTRLQLEVATSHVTSSVFLFINCPLAPSARTSEPFWLGVSRKKKLFFLGFAIWKALTLQVCNVSRNIHVSRRRFLDLWIWQASKREMYRTSGKLHSHRFYSDDRSRSCKTMARGSSYRSDHSSVVYLALNFNYCTDNQHHP